MTIEFVKNRKINYAISFILIVGSIVSLALFSLKPGMDFIGGSLLELNLNKTAISSDQIKSVFSQFGVNDVVISAIGDNGLLIRTREISEDEHQQIIKQLTSQFPGVEESRFESVGPTIGRELKNKSITGVVFVMLGIGLYLTWAFRKVSRPMSSWKYGVVTLVALLHDVLIPIGVFALLGHFCGIEIDSNFIVALLVVLGFSVHDTIVVLDRIREKLRLMPGLEFSSTINQSINETMARSINTSLTLILVLLALFIFGPVSLKNFVLVLLIGTFFGTYSSIFIASPLLYDWYRLTQRRQVKK
jgi:preprotein translocase subunit SecF